MGLESRRDVGTGKGGQMGWIMTLAVWSALVTGIIELLVLGVRKYGLHQMLFVGPQIVWMAPLSYLGFFAGFGLVLALVVWRWPGIASRHLPVFLLTFLGVSSLLFLYHPQLQKLAILLLATGIAIQAARLSAAHPEGLRRMVKCTVGWMVALVVALGVGVHGWYGLAERRALAQLPSAAPDAPNVLLIVLDTVRAGSLSLYGYQRPTTPQLERWAVQGVLFERAVATAPWTPPSHASMFTGRYPHELAAKWRWEDFKPLETTYSTLAEVLRARGYLTAAFVANVDYAGYETGLLRGFTHVEDHPISLGEIVLSSSLGRVITHSPKLRRLIGYHDLLSRKTAAMVNRDFLHWLSRQDQRPFFAFLNYYDAHEPYLPPKPYDKMFGLITARKNYLIVFSRMHHAGRAEKDTMSELEIQAELDAYEGSITYLDHQLGQLFYELERRGILANTLVIVTSDHGEQFGERRLFTHGNSLYLPLIHVPLLMYFPSHIPSGKKIQEPVSLRDLPTTVVDLLKLENAYTFPGTSLARFWDGIRDLSSQTVDMVFSEVSGDLGVKNWYPTVKGDMKSLIDGRSHYIKNGDGREELYDLEDDPLALRDLARSVEKNQDLERFRMFLERLLSPTPQ